MEAVEMKVGSGEYVGNACANAVFLANSNRTDVRFVFNDLELIAHPGDSPTALEREYNERHHARYLTTDTYKRGLARGAAWELLEVLKSIEWTKASYPFRFCPVCRNAEENGHDKDCKLAAAIAKAEGRAQPGGTR